MPVPKRKKSRSRRDCRRSHHALAIQPFGNCPECNQPKPAHRACPHCGFYKGRRVISIKEE